MVRGRAGGRRAGGARRRAAAFGCRGDEAEAPHLSARARALSRYAAGFGFYASRVPERWAPGRFDLVLQSHQLWHLCVLAAIFAWYDGILRARALLHDEGCAAFVSSR